jgi:hypothetical protein
VIEEYLLRLDTFFKRLSLQSSNSQRATGRQASTAVPSNPIAALELVSVRLDVWIAVNHVRYLDCNVHEPLRQLHKRSASSGLDEDRRGLNWMQSVELCIRDTARRCGHSRLVPVIRDAGDAPTSDNEVVQQLNIETGGKVLQLIGHSQVGNTRLWIAGRVIVNKNEGRSAYG